MSRMLTCTAITVVALIANGCSSNNFMVYKNGLSFYVTDDSLELKQTLCVSGDIDSIMEDSKLSDTLQKELKEGMCDSHKARKRVTGTLNGLTSEQNSALKDAFRRNGYEINKISDACGGG